MSIAGDLDVIVTNEARPEFLRAASLAQNARKRELLLARAHESSIPKLND